MFDFTDTTKTLHSAVAPTTGQTIDTVASLGGSTLTLSANTRTLAALPTSRPIRNHCSPRTATRDFVNFLAPTTTEVYSLQINNPSGWTFSSSRTSVLMRPHLPTRSYQSIPPGRWFAGMYAEVALGSASDQFGAGASRSATPATAIRRLTGSGIRPGRLRRSRLETPASEPRGTSCPLGSSGTVPAPVAQGGTDTAPFVMTDNARANAKKDYFGSPFGQYASGGFYNLSVSQSVLGYVSGITKDTAFSGGWKLIVLLDRQYITATEQAAFKSHCESRWPNGARGLPVRAVVNVHGDSIFSGVGATTDTKTTVPHWSSLDSTVLNRTVFRATASAAPPSPTSPLESPGRGARRTTGGTRITRRPVRGHHRGRHQITPASAGALHRRRGWWTPSAPSGREMVFSLGVRPSFSPNTDTKRPDRPRT